MDGGIVIKTVSHGGAENIGLHLLKTKDNERIRSDQKPENFVLRCEELLAAAFAAASRGMKSKQPLIHTSISPGRELTDDEWTRTWDAFEYEFRLIGQPFLSVRHVKERSNGSKVEHEHRVYPGVDLITGLNINLRKNFRRQEKIERILEHDFGMSLVKGRFNKFVADSLAIKRSDVVATMTISGLLDGGPAIAQKTSWESEQEKRTGVSLQETRVTIAQAFLNFESQQGFVENLEKAGFTLRKGSKVAIVVGSDGAIYPLLRSLNKSGIGVKITAKQLESAISFTSLTPMSSPKGRKSNKQDICSISPNPDIKHIKPDNDYLVRLLRGAKTNTLKSGAIVIYHRGSRIVDNGNKLSIKSVNQKNIDLLLDVAASRGWMKLYLTGNDDFMRRTAIEARRRGFDHHDERLKAMADDLLSDEKNQSANGGLFNSESISLGELSKLIDDNAEQEISKEIDLDRQLADIKTSIEAIPDSANEVWFSVFPDFADAEKTYSRAQAALVMAKEHCTEAMRQNIFGEFYKTRSVKLVDAKHEIALSAFQLANQHYQDMKIKTLTPENTTKILALRHARITNVNQFNALMIARKSVNDDWRSLRTTLAKYGVILAEKRFVGKDAQSITNEIKRLATDVISLRKRGKTVGALRKSVKTTLTNSSVEHKPETHTEFDTELMSKIQHPS
jgi:hypothetical protein